MPKTYLTKEEIIDFFDIQIEHNVVNLENACILDRENDKVVSDIRLLVAKRQTLKEIKNLLINKMGESNGGD